MNKNYDLKLEKLCQIKILPKNKKTCLQFTKTNKVISLNKIKETILLPQLKQLFQKNQ